MNTNGVLSLITVNNKSKMFRYVKEDFILTDYSSNDHTTRSVLSIKQFQKKVDMMMISILMTMQMIDNDDNYTKLMHKI